MLEIAGSRRYEVLRRIGAGGMGVVYEAEDKERGQRVALKTIANLDIDKIIHLKREFREVADLSHAETLRTPDPRAHARAVSPPLESTASDPPVDDGAVVATPCDVARLRA